MWYESRRRTNEHATDKLEGEQRAGRGLSQQNTKYEKVLKKPATFTLLEHKKEKSIKSERLKVGNSKREYVFR